APRWMRSMTPSGSSKARARRTGGAIWVLGRATGMVVMDCLRYGWCLCRRSVAGRRDPEGVYLRVVRQCAGQARMVTRIAGPDDHAVLEELAAVGDAVAHVRDREIHRPEQLPEFQFGHHVVATEQDRMVRIVVRG